ncbi:prostaglandin E synthase 3 isoform X1 [Chanodichthys erythropterus]|uniref:prostaglandin E synthase 3 isoform X1 n=1 Tax=Megalobrama amblycephala TaxID=75352 RepID=UPI002013CD35|nr:prostaglandin E synthase 3 isoform X1 [Megalobrama amblycephala]
MQPATAKWYDRREAVFIEFCIEDSKDVQVKFDKTKLDFSCVGGTDNMKHHNEVELFESIDPNESKHKRTDRSVFCCLKKAESGKSWPRLTKEKTKLNWLSVDFNNWKDWEDDSDEELSSFDRFSEVHVYIYTAINNLKLYNVKKIILICVYLILKMMNNMGGEDDLPDVDGADDEESVDSDDEKMPDLE